MLRTVLGWFGLEPYYVSEFGEHAHRYDSIDRAMERPIHPHMSVAPPWAVRKIRRKTR